MECVGETPRVESNRHAATGDRTGSLTGRQRICVRIRTSGFIWNPNWRAFGGRWTSFDVFSFFLRKNKRWSHGSRRWSS